MQFGSSGDERATATAGPKTSGRAMRVAHTTLGAISGAAAGGIGVLLMTPFAPPAAVVIGGFGVIGAVAGYRWGTRVHAVIWNAFLEASGGR